MEYKQIRDLLDVKQLAICDKVINGICSSSFINLLTGSDTWAFKYVTKKHRFCLRDRVEQSLLHSAFYSCRDENTFPKVESST